MESKKGKPINFKRSASKLNRALMDGLDIGQGLILSLMALVLLFMISVPIWLIFYRWGQIFTTFSEIGTYVFFGAFIIYLLFHFFLRSSVWVVQGKIAKLYFFGILLALAFGLWFSDLITMIIPPSAEILGTMLCPEGYENFAVELSARRHDMPGVVTSWGVQDLQCTGDLGGFRPRQYYLFLGTFLLSSLPILIILSITHVVERAGQRFNAPWGRRAVSFLLSVLFIFMLFRYPAPLLSVANVLNNGFTSGGGYTTWLHRYAMDGDVAGIKERIAAGDPVNVNASFEYEHFPLFFAVYKGHLEAARVLLENGADPNRGTPFPLESAVRHKSPEMIRLLLKYNADVDQAESSNGWRALSFAAMKLYHWGGKIIIPEDAMELQIVRLLLEHGADTDGVTEILLERRVPPLPDDILAKLGENRESYVAKMGKQMTTDDVGHYIYNDETDFLRSYLKAGGNPNAVKGKWGGHRNLGLLACAMVDEKFEAMRILLEYGAVPTEKAMPHYTGGLLMWAVKYSPPEAVKILLDGGADPHVKNSNGKTPFEVACSKGRIQIATMIANVTSQGNTSGNICTGPPPPATPAMKRKALEKALRDKDEAGFKRLVKKYSTPDIPNKKGETLLMDFSMWKDIPSAELLLRHGADINRKDAAGYTALHYATFRGGNTEMAAMIEFLAKKGAGLNENRTRYGTPLHSLISRNNYKSKGHRRTTIPAIEILLKYGPDLTLTDKQGKTPLMLANYLKEVEIVKILKKAGARK